MEREFRPLGSVAGGAGYLLPGSRIEGINAHRMRKGNVLRMAVPADVDGIIFHHRRIIRAVRGMAVITGVRRRVLVFRRFPSLESRLMASSADMTFLPRLEQSFIIACMR